MSAQFIITQEHMETVSYRDLPESVKQSRGPTRLEIEAGRARNALGAILPCDIGKMCAKRGTIWQVENETQRAERASKES
jgi:hypothetical protein